MGFLKKLMGGLLFKKYLTFSILLLFLSGLPEYIEGDPYHSPIRTTEMNPAAWVTLQKSSLNSKL
jgi:hypothetical protein